MHGGRDAGAVGDQLRFAGDSRFRDVRRARRQLQHGRPGVAPAGCFGASGQTHRLIEESDARPVRRGIVRGVGGQEQRPRPETLCQGQQLLRRGSRIDRQHRRIDGAAGQEERHAGR